MMKKKLNLEDLNVHSFITKRLIKGGLDNLVDQFDSNKRDCDTERFVCGTY